VNAAVIKSLDGFGERRRSEPFVPAQAGT
jgi:hypothetical protein